MPSLLARFAEERFSHFGFNEISRIRWYGGFKKNTSLVSFRDSACSTTFLRFDENGLQFVAEQSFGDFTLVVAFYFAGDGTPLLIDR